MNRWYLEVENILFVCTGNTCRSPMAAAILESKRLERVMVKSAGVFANDGDIASTHAQAVLRENGISPQHHSKRLTIEDTEWATLVLTMTESHKQLMIASYPQFSDKIFTLKEIISADGLNIGDPFGGTIEDYRRTYAALDESIAKLVTLRHLDSQ